MEERRSARPLTESLGGQLGVALHHRSLDSDLDENSQSGAREGTHDKTSSVTDRRSVLWFPRSALWLVSMVKLQPQLRPPSQPTMPARCQSGTSSPTGTGTWHRTGFGPLDWTRQQHLRTVAVFSDKHTGRRIRDSRPRPSSAWEAAIRCVRFRRGQARPSGSWPGHVRLDCLQRDSPLFPARSGAVVVRALGRR